MSGTRPGINSISSTPPPKPMVAGKQEVKNAAPVRAIKVKGIYLVPRRVGDELRLSGRKSTLRSG